MQGVKQGPITEKYAHIPPDKKLFSGTLDPYKPIEYIIVELSSLLTLTSDLP